MTGSDAVSALMAGSEEASEPEAIPIVAEQISARKATRRKEQATISEVNLDLPSLIAHITLIIKAIRLKVNKKMVLFLIGTIKS